MSTRQKTFAVILMVLFTVGLAAAKDKQVSEKRGTPVKIKAKTDTGKGTARIQSDWEDQADIVLLTSYVTNDIGEVGNCIDLLSTGFIDFYIEYLSFTPKWLRFHFIWTGPEFYYHTTDWIETGYYEYDWLIVSTSTDWLPGTYKLVILMEHDYGEGMGMQTIAQSRIFFY
jgi:hypothetical protein